MALSRAATAPVKEGEVLAAKYRIEKVIGVGGMGVVVSAMHMELDRRVALKFLLPQAAGNDELVGRFVREAKSSVKLKGEHVAKVLDVGRMDDGRAYIVMEHLEGRDLGAELKASDEQFSIEDAVGWMLQVCEGLAEAHALGIIHRDLKPGNLFLTRGTDGRHLVKVLDFGISKSINPNSSDMLSLTKTEMLLGSPLYMAPEQMRSSKYVDERSDIWALGAIAYELLTRRVPFEAETLLDLCFKVAQEGCPDPNELRPEIPAELSQVVMRCLQKEPEGRFNHIGELAMALEPFAGELDRGSAARTMAVLGATADRPRARPATSLAPERDSQRLTIGKRATDSASKDRSLGTASTLVSGTQPAAKELPAEESSSSAESRASGDQKDQATSDARDPDVSHEPALAASGAAVWSGERASVRRTEGKRWVFAGAPLMLLAAGVAFLMSQRSRTDDKSVEAPPLAATMALTSTATTIAAPTAMVEPQPEPSSSRPSSTPAPAEEPATGAPPSEPPTMKTSTPRSPPKPRASASAKAAPSVSAAPKPTSDFIRERE